MTFPSPIIRCGYCRSQRRFLSSLTTTALLAAASLLMGLPLATAQVSLGYAIAFDGMDDSVSVAPHPALDLTTGTIEFWVKPGSLTGNACIVANRGYAAAQTRFSVHLSTNAIGLFDGTALRPVPFSSVAGQWHHIALVCTGGDTEVFVDGVSRGFTGNTFNPNVTGQPFNIGATYDNSGTGNLAERFAGTLDEIRLWNVARTPVEISNNQRLRLTGAETNLVAYYCFDETAGTMTFEATTNHCNGQLVNRPRRVPSYWWPVITLNGANLLTNECHLPFVDSMARLTTGPLAIAAGMYHSLALKADGPVVGWGYNSSGQTNGAMAGSNVMVIAAGGYHSLALKADGTVVGWGNNLSGQGNGASAGSNVVAITAGEYHSLALKTDGTVVAWGNNSYGQANGAMAGSNVVAIAAGRYYNLALRANGTVVGWGDNTYGQVDGARASSNVVAIAAGNDHSLALRADGTVVGWGRNHYGQTNGALAGSNVVAIAAGGDHSLALRADGTVVGWGYNNAGQTNGALAGSNVVAIAAGGDHSLALQTDGTIVGWGYSNYGQTIVPPSVYDPIQPITVSGTVDANVPGTYVLTYHVTNVLGVGSAVIRTVVVEDTQFPVLTLLGDNEIMLTLGEPFVDPGATATDLCAGNLTGSIVSNLTANPNLAGVYTNSFTVTDASGHTVSATRTVVVGLPLATTLTASDMVNGAVTLNGSINPQGSETAAWFEWGTSTWNGNATEPINMGSGTNAVTLRSTLNGLTPGVTYHYRVVATNSSRPVRGADQIFWFPALILNNANPLTNGWQVPFVDPGAKVIASPLAIAAGYNHSLALKANGTVLGWGDNTYGQANVALTGANVVAITAGEFHSLALKADGTVVGWGRNDYGQTNGALAGSNVVAIAAGGSHSLALRADGTVVGWGANTAGQTNGALAGSNVVAIAAGGSHSLALRADGTVVGWGANTAGQASGTPAGSNVVAIAAGNGHSLALKADGTVVGWGYNNCGQTNGGWAGSSAVAIAASSYYSLALRADGTAVGWGWNSAGQTGVQQAGTNVVAIAAGNNHSLALKADGTVVGFGANDFGQRKVPLDAYNLSLPIAVSGEVNVYQPGTYELTYRVTNALGAVSTATRTVVVMEMPLAATLPASEMTNDTVTFNGMINPQGAGTAAWFEWGRSTNYGNTTTAQNIGNGTNAVTVSHQLTGLTPGFVYHYRVVATNSPWLARGADQTFWIPIMSLNGAALTTNELHVPFVDPGVKVTASPLAIGLGNGYSLALRADGTVVGWGRNDYGQANGAMAASNVVAIAGGFNHSLALRADGTVVGWGNNFSGQADGVMAGSNVVAIAAGYNYSLALKADGTVVGWGSNGSGQANGALAGSNVVAIAAGGAHSLALRADSTAVGWGDNAYGKAGGELARSNVVAIAAGFNYSLALKADGTVIGWGDNTYGRATGAQAGSNVVAIVAGWDHNLALRTDGMIVGWGRNDSDQTNVPLDAYNLNLPLAVSGTVDTDVPGTYELTYRVTNALGAVATAKRTVVVGLPLATTLPASEMVNDAVTLNGTVNPKGRETIA